MSQFVAPSRTDREINRPVVLTIAGFDPSGGAGLIADIKTITAFGCRPTAAITSITFQNSKQVFGAVHQTVESLRSQLLAITKELRVASVKTGMLPTREIVSEVARLIREHELPTPIVDPVMRSTSGHPLMEDNALDALSHELMPMARMITPNIPEAERLTGLSIDNEGEMRAAAARLRELGAHAVLLKGGHLMQGSGVRGQGPMPDRSPIVGEDSGQAIDLLDDDGDVTVFRGEWIDAPLVRGTGCMLSTAIAACVARGMTLEGAVAEAKSFVADVIETAK
jgi:hydroxymethylpyrimidine/phosphomethylpyrimidine kinase